MSDIQAAMIPPIFLARPVMREELKDLSPLVVGGEAPTRTPLAAAWLDGMGDPDDPWALVLRVAEDSIPYLAAYHSLSGWRLFVNQEPPAETERVYVFEDVWRLPWGPVDSAPPLDEITDLMESWPVLIAPDSEGLWPGYLEPAHELVEQHLFSAPRLANAGADLPVLLAGSVGREELQDLSPLIIGGWGLDMPSLAAAWLESMGDPNDPWALVLRGVDSLLPYLDDCRSLRGWTLFINEEPPKGAERVYVCYWANELNGPEQTFQTIISATAPWPVILLPKYHESSPTNTIVLARCPLGQQVGCGGQAVDRMLIIRRLDVEEERMP